MREKMIKENRKIPKIAQMWRWAPSRVVLSSIHHFRLAYLGNLSLGSKWMARGKWDEPYPVFFPIGKSGTVRKRVGWVERSPSYGMGGDDRKSINIVTLLEMALGGVDIRLLLYVTVLLDLDCFLLLCLLFCCVVALIHALQSQTWRP